ncbi:MAG: phosphoribosyltransferase family protein [Actinomycetota bacterium]|nr:phosphoribosyltransferase family protein [Actinomycetota bacterium]
MMFEDRSDAGRQLAARLDALRGEKTVVLGLPRGGVPVAFEVARALGAPLDVIIVRKLGVPFQPELGLGAIGEGNVRVLDEEVIQRAGVTEAEVATVEARERTELERRARRFRDDHPAVPLLGRTAVVVDDGIATGSTARAACQVARAQGAAKVVLAVPVAPRGWESRIGSDADELISLSTPEPFFAIGQFYDDFSQTTDEEVIECLERARVGGSAASASRGANDDPPTRDEDVEVQAGSARLGGHLMVPEHALGVVVFAHGSGSSRHSPRNQFVADVLEQAGIGTLLFDLLTVEEELDRANVFDIPLLARRLSAATRWLRIQPDCAGLPVGFFGASTGAAAALWSAAEPGADIAAVVSRGGRPDLAAPRLAGVTAPTLLIVGGRDETVLALNREAQSQLTCESSLVVIPGATHLFEEPGTLLAAAETARDWFVGHLGAPRRRAG